MVCYMREGELSLDFERKRFNLEMRDHTLSTRDCSNSARNCFKRVFFFFHGTFVDGHCFLSGRRDLISLGPFGMTYFKIRELVNIMLVELLDWSHWIIT